MTRQSVTSTILLALAGALASQAQSPSGLTTLPPGAYEHVFRHVNQLKALDDAAASTARPTNFSSYYQKLASLTQQQEATLQTFSLAAAAQLDAQDQQAKTLILQWRAQLPSKLLPGQKPPPPPPQLASLQAARSAMLVTDRTNLIQALGQDAFNRLEQALIGSYRVGPTATIAASPAPRTGR
jgi:hypothetical protein